jgi:hypothetical protein
MSCKLTRPSAGFDAKISQNNARHFTKTCSLYIREVATTLPLHRLSRCVFNYLNQCRKGVDYPIPSSSGELVRSVRVIPALF